MLIIYMNKYSVISIKKIYTQKKLENKNTTSLKHVSALKPSVTDLEAVNIVLNYPYYYLSKYNCIFTFSHEWNVKLLNSLFNIIPTINSLTQCKLWIPYSKYTTTGAIQASLKGSKGPYCIQV